MTTKGKGAKPKKLTVKKSTVKDLEISAEKKGKVKGGVPPNTRNCHSYETACLGC